VSVVTTDRSDIDNLVGRTTSPLHRVLKNIDGAKQGVCHIVRDAAHVPLLQAEGVTLDTKGRLLNQAAFWDFTLECEQRHANKVAAAAATTASTPHVGSSSATEEESGTDNDTDNDTDKDTDTDQELDYLVVDDEIEDEIEDEQEGVEEDEDDTN
jgi:hypothetical protein